MSQARSGTEPTAASLVGSLSSFPLLDVLDLLARTGRTGELQVVGQGLDRRIWVDGGDLVDTGATGSPATGLFEMACIEDGWFYFTLADSTPEVTARATIASVVEGLVTQVAEWHALASAFPFEAVVRMSSTTPADEVQIRADQWQLLSLVGAGREVRDVLASSPMHPLDTLRTLQELAAGHLVSVDLAGDGPATVPPPAAAGSANGEEPATGGAPAVPAPVAPVDAPTGGSTADAVVAEEEPEGEPATAAAVHGTARLPGPVMPPPISGDPWSGAEQRASDDRG